MLTPPPWGWVGYGVSEKLTFGLDYQTTLFGFPAAFIRYQMGDGDVKYAIEPYGVYFPQDIHDKRDPKFQLIHRGGQEWLKLARTSELSKSFRYHMYVGMNYADSTRYTSHEGPLFPEKHYENRFSPIGGLGIEWRMSDWLIFNLNGTYGNTFYYFDQIAYKSMVAYSFILAPFPKTWWGFFARMKIELTALFVTVPDAQYSLSVPIPISPTIYWTF